MKDAMLSCPKGETLAMGLMRNWEKELIWSTDQLPKHVVKTLAPKSLPTR
jgi:hypothetical protein